MPLDRPLLTIAIPTYKRGTILGEALATLAPQLAEHPEVELLICDNASPDNTPEIVQHFIDSGLFIRYHRHHENIGPDANFVFCFHMAAGKYFWLCSDDDIIRPGALDEILGHLAKQEYDLIYATGYGFRQDWRAEQQQDPFNRRFHTFTDPRLLAKVINITFTFISGMIVNKQRLETIPHEDPSAFLDTNLIQLSWTLPLLLNHRRSLVLWTRPIAARVGQAGGYSIGKVFGEKLVTVTARCLPDRPDIAACITNFTIRRWFPAMLYDFRSSGNKNLTIEQAHAELKVSYGRNFRYWLFTYPVLKLPLPLAWVWAKIGEALSKIIYMISIPGFWRKEID
jgi:glycosyltransferase involved in cell wall biosynthesis